MIPAVLGRCGGSRIAPTSFTCHGRRIIGLPTPWPFGVTMYRRQNAAKRAAPLSELLKGSGDGSTPAFGPRCIVNYGPRKFTIKLY